MKPYVVFTRAMVIELMSKGFHCIGKEPNWDKPRYDVYLYEDSPALRQAVAEIKRNQKKLKETKGEINNGKFTTGTKTATRRLENKK